MRPSLSWTMMPSRIASKVCSQILSAALMLRHSFGMNETALRIEAAVKKTVTSGTRTGDIAFGRPSVGTKAMADAIIANL